MKIQRIVLVTQNASKLAEFTKEFDRYGLEVVQQLPQADKSLTDREYMLQLLTQQGESWVVQAVVREEQHVYKLHTDNELATLEDLETVTVKSTLDVWRLSKSSKTAVLDKQSQMALCLKHPGSEVPQLEEGGQGAAEEKHVELKDLEIEHTNYSFQVDGFIDLSKRSADRENVFGWDDIFVVKSTGLTYHEQKLAGIIFIFYYFYTQLCFQDTKFRLVMLTSQRTSRISCTTRREETLPSTQGTLIRRFNSTMIIQ
jgi:hypothetical protein